MIWLFIDYSKCLKRCLGTRQRDNKDFVDVAIRLLSWQKGLFPIAVSSLQENGFDSYWRWSNGRACGLFRFMKEAVLKERQTNQANKAWKAVVTTLE